ncbi:uncharacterized protein TNCV_611241 [Trichonephila clavipes]|nr:uncharacterized protein TNCV_611241 [Trichonephila clavipes]
MSVIAHQTEKEWISVNKKSRQRMSPTQAEGAAEQHAARLEDAHFENEVAAVAEWYRYRIVACLVTSSSPVPLKTRRVGQRCTLNLSRAETSSRWCGVGVRRGGASSVVVHVT